MVKGLFDLLARLSLSSGATRRVLLVVDQGFFSLSNFVLSVGLASNLAVEDYGIFGLLFAVYWFFLGLTRACSSEVLAVAYQESRSPEAIRSGAIRLGVSGSIAGGLLAALLAIFAESGRVGVIAVLAGGVGVALIQDVLRSSAIACGEWARAVWSDGTWLVVQMIGTAIVVLNSEDEQTRALGVSISWLVGALAGLAIVVVNWNRRGSEAGYGYIGRHGNLIWRYVLEFGSSFGAFQLIYFIIAVVVGVAAVGSIRGAYTVVGPMGVVVSGMLAAAVPEMSRIYSETNVYRVVVRAGMYSLVIAAVFGIALIVWYAIPIDIGALLLGDTWSAAQFVVLPVFLGVFVNGLTVGPRAGVRSVSKRGEGILLRLIVAPMATLMALVGLLVSGVELAAWGIVAGNLVGLVVLWWQLLSRARLENSLQSRVI